jgi:hypothetical protein
MIRSIESHAHANGTFELRVTADADTIMDLYRGLADRMAGQQSTEEGSGKALSTVDLDDLITKHGNTAAVRDRFDALWRWHVDDRGWRPGGEVKGPLVAPAMPTPVLLNQRGPLTEAGL